jgi:transcriptional regulator with PAS, ATPase and Fis domain
MRRVDLNPDTEPEERRPQKAPEARAVLLVTSLRTRAVIPLPAAGALTIGRGNPSLAADADAAGGQALLPDTLLSRQHLRISATEGRHEVEDLESRNGTFLDGRRLATPRRLSDGAIVLFGNQVGVYREVTERELEALRREADTPFGPVPSFHPSLARTHARLRKLARTDNEILLVGEAGVGKQLCARAIHRASGRTGPFVSINCASLSPAMVESELYGFVSAAPGTGGNAKRGLIETAEGGTVLLEEIGQMPPELQAKIFRFLQDRIIRPLGRVRPRRVDVRVVATATHVGTALGTDGLRPDLVARLGTEAVTIPPLRRRPEEVPFLVAHFGADAIREVEPAALRALALYGWPLNVRELERTIANACAMSIGGRLLLEHLPNVVRDALQRGATIEATRRRPREAPQRGDLEQLLRQHDGNVAGVARALDRKWNVVQRWLARYKLDAGRFRKDKKE